MGDLIGATEIVFGEIKLGQRLSVRARLVRLTTGQQLPDIADEAPLSEMFPLFERVSERHAQLAQEKGVGIVIEPHADDIRTVGDPMRLEQAVQNLAANALRHTPPGADTTAATLARLEVAFEALLTRDDGPIKPDPWPVSAICRRWQLPPQQVVMIGDFRFDVESGRAAGTRTVLLAGVDPATYPNEERADLVLSSLRQWRELLAWLEI